MFALDWISLGIGAALGAALVFWRVLALEKRNAALQARLDSERAGLEDRFSALAQQVLKTNSESFMTLAQEKLKAAQADGAHDLDKRSLAISELVKPVAQHLAQLKGAVDQLQGTDKAIREDLQSLNRETARLTGALRNPAAQGKWGEFVLEAILERANLIKGVHYSTQEQIEGGRRPDVIINLHDGFRIAIDSKAPINEYVVQLDQDLSETDSLQAQGAMAKAVRAHVKTLGAKTYQDNISGSDFVILFLPSEAVFSATLRSDPSIVDYAAENHVVIASPTLIISLLRVVGLSWRQVEMAKNAAEISALGADLHKRFSKFLEHFAKVGKGINTAAASFDDAVGSMNKMVLPAARKFTKLHANNQNADLADIAFLEKTTQRLLLSGQEAATEEDGLSEQADKVSHG